MKRAIVCMFLLCFVSCPIFAAEHDAGFEELARKFVDEYPAFSPVNATCLGDHRHDSLIEEISTEAFERKNMYLRNLEVTLYEFEYDKLSVRNRIDHELLRNFVHAELFRNVELREWRWNPTVYTGMSGGAVYNLMARDFAPLENRLSCVADRLERFPQFLDEVRNILDPDSVPKTHAETAINQNRGVLSIIENMVVPHLGKLSPSERDRLEKAIKTASDAIEKHQEWLENTLLPNAKGDFRIGKELFERKLVFSLGTKMSRAEIRDRAEKELLRVRTEMYGVAQTIILKDDQTAKFPEKPTKKERQEIIERAFDIICRELPPRDKLVETARETLKTATEFVREKDFLTLPHDPVEIILMPEFQRGFSVAYCDSPGALDVGQKTFYAISPIPEDWSEEQVRSFLREYNFFSINNLTIHEAMPGHYVQLAMAGRYPDKLRGMLESGTFIEGWAVYTERLMVEQGYLNGDPGMKLVQLKWYLRTITNAIIDQAIHVDGMDREEAIRFMVEDGFQEEREAALKWTRAQLSSTQLSTYFVGYQELASIREECEKRAGDKFNLKEFHDKLLSFGSPDPRFVRMLMLGE